MKKIISEPKRRKRKILKEFCCPIRSRLTTLKKKKLGKLSLHENWMRTLVLRIFECFSRHIALVCGALYWNELHNISFKRYTEEGYTICIEKESDNTTL